MADKKIYLSSPTMHGEEQEFIKEAFDTNWVAPLGPNVNAFEKEMAEYVGIPFACALSAGTAAIHLALRILGVGQGDVVFAPTLTFSATCNPIVYEKATPVFIDSERDTWNMDPEALRRAFEKSPAPKAVIVVHLYGTPAKLDEIMAICQEHGVPLVEDAAESLGSTYKGKHTGTFGRVGIFSFNGNKIITGSSGGALLTDSKPDADKVRKWSTQSREAALWYQHEELGYNYRMSNVIAGVVRGQMEYIDVHIAKKKAIYERYQEGLSDLPVRMNPLGNDSIPNYWLSCMTVDPSAMCEAVRSERGRLYRHSKGKTCPDEILDVLAGFRIEGRPIWKPMHLQALYRGNNFVREGTVSVGEDIFARGLCLPSDVKMTEEEQDVVIEIIRRCFE